MQGRHKWGLCGCLTDPPVASPCDMSPGRLILGSRRFRAVILSVKITIRKAVRDANRQVAMEYDGHTNSLVLERVARFRRN
jgi:hypothetical protein